MENQPSRSNSSKLLLLLVIAGLLLVYFGVLYEGRGGSDVIVGKTLRELKLQPLIGRGEPVSLDDLRGKVVLINFWGTWCPPCRQEFPELVKLVQQHARDADFRFLSVSCPAGLNVDVAVLRKDTLAFLQQAGVELSVYVDPDSSTQRAITMQRMADGFGYPTTLILDRQGGVRGFWEGYDPQYIDQMESLVQQLLAEKSPAAAAQRLSDDARVLR